MRILIVGNGSTGVHNNEEFFINNHTGNFIKNLESDNKIKFVQYSSKYNINNDLQNFDLKRNNISFEILGSNKSLITYYKILKLIRESDFIYIFFPGTLGRIFALMCGFLNKKFSLYIRGEKYLTKKIDKKILKNSRFILTVSDYFVPNLSKYCKNVATIKPMISITKSDFLFFEREINNKVIKLLFVGRVENEKGIFELIEISKFLMSKGMPFELKIIGGGEIFEDIQKQIISEGLENHVFLLGQISDKNKLLEYYKNSNAFLFPSHNEGFPRVLYEAMSSALPIFTTFVGGIPGLMKNNINCIEIPKMDGNTSGEIVYQSLLDYRRMLLIGKEGQNTLEDLLGNEKRSHHEMFNILLNNEENYS